jgi:hypothetical protein
MMRGEINSVVIPAEQPARTMAIWQYITYLIPAASVGSDGTLSGIVVGDDGFELPPLSFPFTPTEFDRRATEYLAPAKSKSWSEMAHFWGDEQKDDLFLFAEGEEVVEVRARLDLRDLTIERVRKLLRFTEALKCCFVEGRKGEVFAATEEALLNSIRTSRSAAFVVDPHGFLERLSQGDN